MRALLALVTLALTGVATAAPAAAQGPGPGCSWYVQSNPDAVNIAFPDESAIYWGTGMAQIPSTGLVLRGRFPRARYFSIHAYDPALRPVGAIADRDIRPDSGRNRFRRGSRGRGGTYTLRIVPEARPERPAPNTIYAGSTFEGQPNPGGFVLYRIYVPQQASDPTGGVGLPDVSFSAAGGEVEVPFGRCDVTGALPDSGLNGQIRDSDYPDDAPRTRPTRDETEEPLWNKFFGYGTVLRAIPDNPITPAVTPGGGGFLSNVHNDYVSAAINRTWGDVVVFRARMPTFPDTRRGERATRRRQVRYWSICQNESVSQRYVACVADHQAVLDRKGRATFVISDPGDRPRNADRRHKVNWIPWGGAYPSGRIIYRQMVAAKRFKRSIARVKAGEPAAKTMGRYYPKLRYCPKERFETAGARGCLAAK